MNRISGFHIHALCGNSSRDFNNLISASIENFSDYFTSVSWINLGGGQAFTEDDFDFADFQGNLDILHTKYHLKTYIEPCEYLVMNSGFLVVTVLDIVHNEKDIAILDRGSVLGITTPWANQSSASRTVVFSISPCRRCRCMSDGLRIVISFSIFFPFSLL